MRGERIVLENQIRDRPEPRHARPCTGRCGELALRAAVVAEPEQRLAEAGMGGRVAWAPAPDPCEGFRCPARLFRLEIELAERHLQLRIVRHIRREREQLRHGPALLIRVEQIVNQLQSDAPAPGSVRVVRVVPDAVQGVLIVAARGALDPRRASRRASCRFTFGSSGMRLRSGSRTVRATASCPSAESADDNANW